MRMITFSRRRASRGFLSLYPLLLVTMLALLLGVANPKQAQAQEKGAKETASDWQTVAVPETWRKTRGGPYAPREGYVWFRCAVHVPANWQSRAIEIFSEPVDDVRAVYINGQWVGAAGEFPPLFRSGLGGSSIFPVSQDVIRFGETNVVAMRIYVKEGRGGFNVAAPVLFGGDEAIRLQGMWQVRSGDDESWAQAKVADLPASVAFTKLSNSAAVRKSLKKLDGEIGPLNLTESLAHMKTPDDLSVDLVLGEPEVRQPLSIKWDERGRLWVMQYLQYPDPAGLKMVSRDKFLRSVYDKTPAAPPNHVRGQDKITIHEDTNGDGVFDKHKTFVDGLSIVSSFAIGRGGVWVLNPPYLLFYPDKNRDDIPDADPVVHLEGFGIEDSHSIANSLRWGPDGWLYAAQGSTVTGDIRRPGEKKETHSLGQLIWRYHPEKKIYEIFAEGGGNTFGVEIDSQGRTFSGTNGGDTRGYHYVQGGYSRKAFGKHGALSNPYAFGYFNHMAHHKVPRFTHTFVIYEGGALPSRYNGNLFGVGPLQSHVLYSQVERDGASFKTHDLGYVLTTDDTWFRPVDIQVGPDGALYVADFYEQRIDHASHHQGRVDKTTGRIYRLRGKQAAPLAPFDLGRLTDAELVDVLRHRNKWFRQTALRLIGDRKSASLIPLLKKNLREETGQLALESLWALHLSGGFDESIALELLGHANPSVRSWAIRLIGDTRKVSPKTAGRLAELAYREPEVDVRAQLACTARRLPGAAALPIIRQLLTRSEDNADVFMPLLLWWAVESKAAPDRQRVLAMFADKSIWDLPLVRDQIAGRLMRRYAMAGGRADLLACAALLNAAPDQQTSQLLMKGFELAFAGRSLAGLPPELIAAMAKAGGGSLALRVRQGQQAAVDEALQLIAREKSPQPQRLEMIQTFGETRQPACVPVLLAVLRNSKNEAVRSAVLGALQNYQDAAIAQEVVRIHNKLSASGQEAAQALLASRKVWSVALLEAVEAGDIPRESVADASVRRLLFHNDQQIAAAVRELWGDIQGATTDEMRSQIEQYAGKLRQGSGNPYEGKKLFAKSCGKCHTLFTEGGRIGPNLTAYKRDDLNRMLLNVVNPSAEIREGFENYVVLTDDGRQLNGFISDQDSRVVVLKTTEGQAFTVDREEIDDMRAIPISLMPQGLLKDYNEQQLRDLFAYLRATQPLN